MRGNKEVHCWHRLLPFVLGVFLLAGLFGLLAPEPALAIGGDLEISGPGLNNPGPIIITQNQLQGKEELPPELQSVTGWVYLPQHDEWYSTINTWPTKSWYRGQGVKLTDLLKLAGGLNENATLIRFTAKDGFKVTFTVQELLNEPRYRFPKFIDYGLPQPDRLFGHIPGDPSGAVPVEAIIAHRSFSAQNIADIQDDENFSRADANHLLYGQRAVTQQTNARFAKYTVKIEVLTDPVLKWNNPTASVAPGEVPVGTKVVLHSPFDDEDKVHYTLDSSDPTIESPMYNWIASRWWSSRQDVLNEINRPIEITEDTVIKAFVTGPGRADSDIVTFEYTVPTVSVTGVTIAEGDRELAVGQTVQLSAVVEPENATNKNVTWGSDNEAVATVDATGLVTAVSAGTATITVTTEDGGLTDSITVSVVPASVRVTGVSITEGDQTLEVGQTVQLTAVVEPADATNKNVAWSSSDKAVATVDATGLVTAVSAGTATITVTTEDGGFTDSITVTVVPASDFVVVDGVLKEYKGPGGDVVIPGDLGITKIGSMVFAYLSSLTSVVIPEGVTTIDGIAFEGCNNLFSVVIPNSVKTIGGYAFAECPKLTEIAIPEGVTSIEKGTFYRCSALRSVTLPSTITSIGEEAFQQCSVLPEITIPEGVTSIGKNAFRSCSALAEIVIPGNVTSIGDSAFYKCTNLTAVTILSTETTFGNGVFSNSPNVTIYGYSGSTAEAYAAANSIPFVAIAEEVSQYAFDYELPSEIVEGQDVEVAVTFASVEVKDQGYEGVRFKFSAAGPGDVTFAAEDSNGVVHTFINEGYWGPAGGFDLPADYSATTDWTLNFAQAGNYTVTFSLIDAVTDEVIDGITNSVDVTVEPEPPAMDVLYDGTVTLTPGETFTVTAYNSSVTYTVYETTPLGALQAAATAGGFTYDVTDKNYGASGALLLDNVGTYLRDSTNKIYWYAYVNDVYKDGFNNPDGALNLIELVDGDRVEFYYAAGIADPADLNAVKAAAIAAVKTVASTGGGTPTDWTLQLSGARQETVTKAYFEDGLACPSSGHQVFWTDGDGNVWGGVPLWLLVAMVDDDPDAGPAHFNFNDDLAAQHYEVNVISGDGWKATLDSADIAHNDGYIVANTLNGEPLPLQTESGKPCWPLHLKGEAVFGGQQVGNIVRIELSGLPEPPAGWTLEMLGDVGDTITQEEFEEGLACTGSGHYREWTDKDGNVWSGVPLWVLLGAVDDIETSSHWTFNDDAAAAGYSVKVVAGDGFSRTFASADVARSDNYIVANKCNGEPLTGDSGPLRLVGPGVTKDDGSLGGSAVGNIVRIEIPELQTPEAAPGSWNLTLKGKISDVISQAEFEAALACPNSGHLKEWTDKDGNVWSGIPLWFLAGWVDDRQPHDYDANQATAGYTILVKAGDGYTKDFASADVAWSNDYIIANKCNGAPLTGSSAPLRLVGAGVAKDDGSLGGTSVGNVVEIELTSFETAQPVPQLRIVKYGEDGTTIIDEKTVDHLWMQKNLEVIGDGTTVYRFEGVTFDPDNLWDPEETYPGGFKIENAVKGTRIRDLCELVGGMGAGTEIVLVARDGYETRLPYSSIYPDPSVQARQGDAILAWWADGKYVPDYKDGMRLFFTPDDHIYGQWDMHETLPEQYWHYYYSDGVQYPSCAGLSAKWITEIRVYSVPQGDWTLKLDGRDIGGMKYDVSKTYFEQALACQFGADHKAVYTDTEGNVWEGMPLWFLAGFVDDADQHSDNAFNDQLAMDGYQVVITAADGYSITIDSADIIRNSNYIVANTLNGAPIPESDSNWPLRLVGPAVSGSTSISQIVSIKLVPVQPDKPQYNVEPAEDDVYTIGETEDGIKTMTVNPNQTGFKYFTVSIEPVEAHVGTETVVFVHLRNGEQLELNATGADFDQVDEANAGFNVQPGDVVKVFIVDQLTNDPDRNPVILQ